MLDTLAIVVEHTPVAIAMFDRQMRYVLANKQWVQEFNLSQAQPLVGKSQYEVFPKLHPGWRQLYERALQGYAMRSDHPLQTAAGGPSMLFRCEVRPWREKHDASVAGVVVTCTKFTGQTAAAPEANPGVFDLAATDLPIFSLDPSGRIMGTNRKAAEMSLARGLEEGETHLWDVLADETGRHAVKQSFEELAGRLLGSSDLPPQILTLKSGMQPVAGKPDSDEAGRSFTPPCRWMLARHGEDGARLTLVGLTGLSPFEAVTKVGIQLPAPPNGHTPGPAVESHSAAAKAALEREVAALREQVARLQIELRTHREAEATLVKREGQRQSALEALPGGVLGLDGQGCVQWHNSRLRQLLGHGIEPEQSVEEWLGLSCPDESHRAEVQRIWREDVWRRQLTRTLSLVSRDGLLREIELRPVSLNQGGLLVHFQDVSAACRLEEQLSALESKFRVLLQDNPLPVVIADKTGCIYDANRAATDLFLKSRAELRRLPVDTLLTPDSAAARQDALREMRQSGEIRQRLTVHLAGEDAPRMHLTLAAVPAANGEVHSTMHFFETPISWGGGAGMGAQPKAEVGTEIEVEAGDPPPVPAATEAPKITLLLATQASGRVNTWSEAAAQVFGYDEQTALRMPLHQLFQPSDASGFYAAVLPEAVRQGQADWVFYGRDGRRGRLACLVRLQEPGSQQVELWISEAERS